MIEHHQICDTCGGRTTVTIVTFDELEDFFVKSDGEEGQGDQGARGIPGQRKDVRHLPGVLGASAGAAMSFEDTLRAAIRAELAPLLERQTIEILEALVLVQREIRKGQPPKPLLTTKEAAVALGISLSSVHRRIKDGSLRSVRFGTAVRVDISGLRSPEEIAEETRLKIARARRGL